ncbi:unnamed protein product, partial [Nesidiocoris tenuis]
MPSEFKIGPKAPAQANLSASSYIFQTDRCHCKGEGTAAMAGGSGPQRPIPRRPDAPDFQ